MVIRHLYVCRYCGSPRVEYKEIVKVGGISICDDGGVIEDRDYDSDSEYCYDCEDETYTVDALLIVHDDKLYEIIEDYSITVFKVPYEKDGVCLYFNGKPKLLCECVYNDITKAMLSTMHNKNASEDEKRSALQALLQIAGTNEAGVEENADASAY
jgi:hypothetical protein